MEISPHVGGDLSSAGGGRLHGYSLLIDVLSYEYCSLLNIFTLSTNPKS